MKNSIKIISDLDDYCLRMSSIKSFKSFKKEFLKIISDIVDYENMILFLEMPYSDKISIFLSKGYTLKERDKIEQSLDSKIYGFAYKNKELIYIPNAQEDNYKSDAILRNNNLIHSAICLPVISNNISKGSLLIECKEINSLNEEQIATLLFVCKLAGRRYNLLCKKIENAQNNKQRFGQYNQILLKSVNQLKKEKERVEEASRVKSEFIANISHEIRTPMNAIMGFSEILLNKIKNPLYKSHLRTIVSSGKTLLALINDILDLSKIESGNLEFNYEPVSLIEILDKIKEIFKEKALNKNIDIRIEIEKDFPKSLMLDELRIYQVLFNLVGNAIKFTEKGYVKISAKNIDNLNKSKASFQLIVEDTGIGIKKSEQEKIFAPFKQKNGQDAKKYGGTGLGLAITKQLVERMNGKISVKSKTDNGSKFIASFKDIEINNYRKAETIKKISINKNIKFEKAKILIVDDIKFNIVALTKLIDDDNITFLNAANGRSALSILKYEKPDFIFMDLTMPGLDGYQVTKKIKANPNLKNIPVVAYTASAMKYHEDEINATFDGLLRKPANKETILNILKQHLKYEVIEAKKEVNKKQFISEKEKDIKSKILFENKSKLLAKWTEIKDNLIITNLEDFADIVMEFSNKIKIDIFSKYALNLKSSIDNIEIEELEINLKMFPKKIAEIETLLSKKITKEKREFIMKDYFSKLKAS